jgi:DnaK suppressor protein
MSSISAKQIDSLRVLMEAELAQLVVETQDEIGGDGDTGDEAVADNIVDTENAVIGMHLQKITDINAAIDRINASVYGVCIDCRSDIDYERLSAYPTAKRCIRCQHLHEKTFASEPKSSF